MLCTYTSYEKCKYTELKKRKESGDLETNWAVTDAIEGIEK